MKTKCNFFKKSKNVTVTKNMILKKLQKIKEKNSYIKFTKVKIVQFRIDYNITPACNIAAF